MTVFVPQRNHMWGGSPLSLKARGLLLAGEGILNQTIVSDVARLHLDFILCNDSLQLATLKRSVFN